MTPTIECVVPSRSIIGEGAVWDVDTQRLWWVDITAGLIHCYDPSTGRNKTVDFGEKVGCLALRRGGGLVVAAKSGFWFFDPDSGAREAIHDPEAHLPDNRFNDGTTDMQGRFWAGTMTDEPPRKRSGRFYRLDADRSVTPWGDRLHVCNGMAFSPDGKTMYFSDSYPDTRTIFACDYDTETGTPGAPRVFFDTRAVAGRPDGGTVDADGCYWQAGVDGWQLYRITPQGRLDMTIDLPVERPSRPMFGGPDLKTLFVTSLAEGITPGTEDRQPEAGSLFAITGHGAQGVPQVRFSG